PEQAATWPPARAQETKARPEALVKSITHSQPAPVHQVAPAEATPEAPKPATGLFKRLINWLTGGEQPKAAVETVAEPHEATRSRRGRGAERSGEPRGDRN